MNMVFRNLSASAVMVLALVIAAPAQSKTVTYSGIVDTIFNAGTVSIGDIMTVKFDIDEASPVIDSATAKRWLISNLSLSIGATLTVDLLASSGQRIFDVYNEPYADGFGLALYNMVGGTFSGTGGLTPVTFSSFLLDNSATALSGVDLPSTVDVNDFDRRSFNLLLRDGQQSGTVNGTLTNLTIAAVPIPASLPILLAGLGALGVLRRGKRAAETG